MRWDYKGVSYTTEPVDWRKLYYSAGDLETTLKTMYPRISMKEPKVDGIPDFFRFVVYHKKWGRCYTMSRFGIFGNGNNLKFCLEDIYTKKLYYAMALDIEVVVKAEN